MGGGRRRVRHLSEEEKLLWDKVAESVAPLTRRRRRRAKEVADEAASQPTPIDAPVSAPPTVRPLPPHPLVEAALPAPGKPKPRAKPAPTPLAPIDTRTKRKLVRGTVSIDERLDLHGLTQQDAHAALRRFLAGAQARGARMVIVITGKGRPSADGYEADRGVLRRIVPQWLSLPDLRGYVVGFEEAHAAHGGVGALYVRLRRARGFTLDGERP